MVLTLLKSGADVNSARPSDGASPLWMAASQGHVAVVTTLLRANADVCRGVHGVSALHVALLFGHNHVAGVLAACRPAKSLTPPLLDPSAREARDAVLAYACGDPHALAALL